MRMQVAELPGSRFLLVLDEVDADAMGLDAFSGDDARRLLGAEGIFVTSERCEVVP